MSFSNVAAEVVDPVVNYIVSALRSASKEPTVKSCVLTSSTGAAFWPQPNVEFEVGEDSWNTEFTKLAYEVPDDDPMKGGYVYCASKLLGEKAALKFIEDEKPGFSLNVIVPNLNIGPVLDPSNYSSSAAMIKGVFEGDLGVLGQWVPRK